MSCGEPAVALSAGKGGLQVKWLVNLNVQSGIQLPQLRKLPPVVFDLLEAPVKLPNRIVGNGQAIRHKVDV